jgi:hypothetical protein
MFARNRVFFFWIISRLPEVGHEIVAIYDISIFWSCLSPYPSLPWLKTTFILSCRQNRAFRGGNFLELAFRKLARESLVRVDLFFVLKPPPCRVFICCYYTSALVINLLLRGRCSRINKVRLCDTWGLICGNSHLSNSDIASSIKST